MTFMKWLAVILAVIAILGWYQQLATPTQASQVQTNADRTDWMQFINDRSIHLVTDVTVENRSVVKVELWQYDYVNGQKGHEGVILTITDATPEQAAYTRLQKGQFVAVRDGQPIVVDLPIRHGKTWIKHSLTQVVTASAPIPETSFQLRLERWARQHPILAALGILILSLTAFVLIKYQIHKERRYAAALEGMVRQNPLLQGYAHWGR